MSQSPDLKPTELLWEQLNRKVKVKKPTSALHRRTMLQECWNGLAEQSSMFLEEKMRIYSAAITARAA